jgi:hypothetical protein
MHIAAVMAALDVWDLDRSAKQALLVLACRADRYTAMASVSIGRVATDMSVNYDTAQAALTRLVDSGYLIVDKSPGRSSIWQLTSRMVREVPTEPAGTTSRMVREDLPNPSRGEGVFREKQGAPSRRSRKPASDDAGENPEPRRAAFAAGSGWLPNWSKGEDVPPAWTPEQLAERARARTERAVTERRHLVALTDADEEPDDAPGTEIEP